MPHISPRYAILVAILCGLTLASVALAEEKSASGGGAQPPCHVFQIGNASFNFISLLENHLTISQTCRDAQGALNCDGYRAIRSASMALIKGASLNGGINPGSLMCPKLGGQNLQGQDPQGNQNSFCRFPDGSAVDSGSLVYYARKNDAEK